jgi:hypothetical protein
MSASCDRKPPPHIGFLEAVAYALVVVVALEEIFLGAGCRWIGIALGAGALAGAGGYLLERRKKRRA